MTASGGIYVSGDISTAESSLSNGLYYILFNGNTYFGDDLTYFNSTPDSSGSWPHSTINVQDNSLLIGRML